MWFRKRPDEPENFAPRAFTPLKKRVDAALAKLASGEALPESLFTSSVWSRHKGAFELKEGQGKCSFCERYRDMDGECQLDHFRPKTAVSVFASPPNYTDAERPKIEREGIGYWWLAYTWTNLVLVCPGCNIAKSSLFPVKKRCAMREGASTDNELPYLLDPHDTSLGNASLFEWTISGTIAPVTRGSRAEWTIAICNLDRDGLRTERVKRVADLRKAFNKYVRALKAAADSEERNGGAMDRVREQRLRSRVEDLRAFGRETAEHTGLARWMVAQWCKEKDVPFEW